MKFGLIAEVMCSAAHLRTQHIQSPVKLAAKAMQVKNLECMLVSSISLNERQCETHHKHLAISHLGALTGTIDF
jgi:hypothetical protein